MKKSRFRKVTYLHKNEYMVEPKLKLISYANQEPKLNYQAY